MNNETLSIAIMSGKGGVGKSNLALNLGFALARQELPPLLMDCDMGLANLDVLLGLTPEGNLQDMLLADTDVQSIVCPVEPGFDILPAASGVPELVDMDADMRSLLLSRLEPIFTHYKILLLDLGAGIHETVQAFASMAAIRLVVLTPEPTSLTDAYALMKVLNARQGIRDFLVVVNQVESKREEEQTFQRLKMACEHFLQFTPVLLGSVRYDIKMQEAVRKQAPLLKLFPKSPASQDICNLAARLAIIRTTMLDILKEQPVLRPLA